jgi:GT2 family glycosyltransferase
MWWNTLQQHGTKWILYIYGAPAPVVGGIQAMDGLFLAFRRDVIEKLGWDEQTFAGFHLYDMDVTYRAFLAGYKLAVANDLHLFHASGGNFTGVWQQEAHRFVQKFAGKLALNSPREGFRFAVVELPSKEAARDIMSPPHWAFPELLPETTSPSANS